MSKKLKINIGDKYGKWIVLGEERKTRDHRYILCCCDCKRKKFIRVDNLVYGKSSGCNRCSSGVLKHGETVNGKLSSEYISWYGMKQRCYNKNMKDYKYYGGRGIKVCEQWRNSFENFLLDMGRKPTRLHTLDRKDGNGNYESGNCRWATSKEQHNNYRAFNPNSIDIIKI